MSKTRAVKLSDAEIRRQSADVAVHDLRDPRHPGLYLRFGKDRQRGSWYLVKGKAWKRLARWPELSAAAIVAELPALRQRLLHDPEAAVAVGQLATCGQLIDWYGERMSLDRSLSAKRKAGAKSAIKCHLKPRLEHVPLRDLTAAVLDRELMWPCQQELSLSYVHQLFVLLVVAFLQASKLGLIDRNPMAEMKFVDFTKARIMPKAARLRGGHLAEVVPMLAGLFEIQPGEAMLALMMLCHGTRVGETRMARWSDISIPDGEWFIPAENTKTRTEHRVPLTAQAKALLTRYRAIQLARGYEGIYLFPSRRGRVLSEGQASAVFTRIGQGEWTSHDLRKVARTAWTDLGIDGHIGEMLLNHSLGKIASTYINTQARAQRLAALEKWHNWLDERGLNAIHNLTDTQYEDSQNPAHAANGEVCEPVSNIVNGEVSKC
ncbi:phage integrase family protein [Pseudomonas graminis]|uniref:tyrosine-type recombinase/integrase n=1 Tax=Pseudomonas graminis TaxID=158627 RepID=UPI0010620EFC|nr:site-specific integrase [Pseudomonas graminis]TDV54456.1 phage integrase family protein [Pseudomonas graminis]